MSAKGLLFIDANQYLDLYQIAEASELLPALEEQRDHILVTTQIVDEVLRRKVYATSVGRNIQFEKLSLPKNGKDVEKTKEEFKKQSHELLLQVSQSKDEVSSGLADLFARAVTPTEDEIGRAKLRKAFGNPPGKPRGALGDQVSWEQLLSQCRDKPKLWIITKDSDYGTVHEGKMFLNAALYQELAGLYRSEPTVFCFDNITDGIEHFAETTGAKAEHLPSRKKAEEIKEEQRSLPPLGWLNNYDDSAHIAIQSTYSWGDSILLTAALRSHIVSEEVIPPPATEEADKAGT